MSEQTQRNGTKRMVQIVERYLRSCEAGDLEEARGYLVEDFTMVFPVPNATATLRNVRSMPSRSTNG